MTALPGCNSPSRLLAALSALVGAQIMPAGAAVAETPLIPQTSPPIEAATRVEVLVRFRDDRTVKEIVDVFWKDEPAARQLFENLKQDFPDLAGARLVRVTYSSELVLAFEFQSDTAGRRSSVDALAARLGGLPFIAYAEPDHRFSTQGPPF